MAKDIRVTLELDNKQYNRSIKESQSTTKKFASETKTSLGGLKTAFAGLVAAIGVREVISLSDEFSNLRNRLVAVTGSQEDAANALDLVNQVAAQSRSDIGSVASLFADLTVATRDLGTSQQEIADVTRVFSQTLQISGADAGAAAGAIRQFGQALASGVLRGDEFNSIAETNSFFMLQFADSLGVPIGKLRDLAKEGKLTADLILQATQDMKAQVEADFSNTATTVSQAFTSLRNSVINLFGEIEGETGVFEGLAGAIQGLADAINNVDIKGFIDILDELVYIAGLLISVFGMKGMLSVLYKVQGAFIAAGGVFASTGKTLFSFNRGVVAAKQALKGLFGVLTLGFGFKGKGGFFGAMGMAVANVGRVLLRFVIGPLGALLTGLELLSLASKALGGPDFMAGPRDAIIGFGKDLLGFNEDLEETNENINDLLNPDENGGGGGGGGGSQLDDRLQKFKESLDALKVTTPEYQKKLKELNETFSKDTVAELRLYNQALSALNQAFPEQAEEIKKLIAEQEKLAEKQAELKLLEEQGKQAISNFTEGLKQQFFTTEELEEKQSELNALLSKYPELANLIADAQDNLNQKFSDNEGINNFLDTLATAQKSLSEDLATALLEGEKPLEAFKNFFKKIVQQILADIIRLMIIQPILGSILAPFGLGFGTGGSIVRNKAVGGPVMKDKPYIVGERGPEMFVPNSAGSIMRNDQMGMGGAVTYNIQAVDARSFQQLVASDPEFIFSVTEAGRRRIPGRF